MLCPYCRNQIIDGKEVCPNCGAKLSQIQSQPQQNNNIHPEQSLYNQQQNYDQQINNNQNKKKSNIVPIIIIVVLLSIVTIVVANKFLNKKDSSSSSIENDKQIGTVESNDNNTTTTNNTTGTIDPNTNLTYDENGAFLMAIEDVYTIAGRGTVVTGKIERGTIALNDTVQIIGLDHEIITTTVIGLEIDRKSIESAKIGDTVGIIIKDVNRSDVEQGQVLAKPNSIKATTKFEADIYFLTKEEGGRNTPLSNNYRPQFHFRTADITGTIALQDGIEMINPGENAKINVELTSNIAMEVGTEFDIREGGKVVGKGKITNVY